MQAVFSNDGAVASSETTISCWSDRHSASPTQLNSATHGPLFLESKDRSERQPLPDSRPRILIVDDDDSVRSAVSGYFVGCKSLLCLPLGYSEALVRPRQHPGDLFVINLVGDAQRAFDFCRSIRTFSDVPIIVYGPHADDVDEVLCFELGADEFFVRFPSARILTARISSLLRRSMRMENRTPARPMPASLEFEGLVLDCSSFIGRLDERLLRLSESEFRLLALLAERPNELVLHGEIEDALLSWGMTAGAKAIHHRIHRINVELRRANENGVQIKNLKRSGYSLVRRPLKRFGT